MHVDDANSDRYRYAAGGRRALARNGDPMMLALESIGWALAWLALANGLTLLVELINAA
jgi:hypothetical protein